MAKFRKKPVIIDAVQYDGNFRCLDCFSINEVSHFIVSKDESGRQCIKIPTLEGVMIASIDDYIIRGVNGEYYPCKPDIFEMTYELVNKNTSMTPKEKAKELFDKFDILISTDSPNWKNEGINCAMVAVEEIKNILSMPNMPKYYQIATDEYWKEVKQELEKL